MLWKTVVQPPHEENLSRNLVVWEIREEVCFHRRSAFFTNVNIIRPRIKVHDLAAVGTKLIAWKLQRSLTFL